MQKLVADYREKILGKSCVKWASSEYWEIGLINDLKISLTEWDVYPIHVKARIMARHYLANMVSLIDAHYDEQDRIVEKQQQERDKANGKNQGGGSSN